MSLLSWLKKSSKAAVSSGDLVHGYEEQDCSVTTEEEILRQASNVTGVELEEQASGVTGVELEEQASGVIGEEMEEQASSVIGEEMEKQASIVTGVAGKDKTLEEGQTEMASLEVEQATCLIPLKPNQPMLESFPQRLIGNQKRSFCSSWYSKCKWLHYQEGSDCVFCYCLVAEMRNLPVSRYKDEIFL